MNRAKIVMLLMSGAFVVLALSSCRRADEEKGMMGADEARVVIKIDQGPAIGVSQGALNRLEAYRSKSKSHSANFGFGRPATAEEIEAWDRDVMPDGHGLPEGAGTVAEGAAVYALKCAHCHGPNGEGVPPYVKLVGRSGSGKTVGNFWPYATTVFDYVRSAMPFDKAGTLTDSEVYGLAAWILFKNEIISEDTVLDANTLPQIEMPNRSGFVFDDRELYKDIH